MPGVIRTNVRAGTANSGRAPRQTSNPNWKMTLVDGDNECVLVKDSHKTDYADYLAAAHGHLQSSAP